MVVLIAGCLPSTGQITPGFRSYMTASGYAFTAAEPLAGAIPATEILARLRGERGEPPFFPGMSLGEPVYGIISCVDAQTCGEGGVIVPGSPMAVWFVPLATSGAANSDGWAVMDATTGVLIWPDG